MAVFTSVQQKHAFMRELQAHQAAAALATDPSTLVEPHPTGADLALLALIDAVKLDVVTFYETIPVGADIAKIRDKWVLWLLREELKPSASCEAVAKLYERRLAGDTPKAAEWEKARKDANFVIPTTSSDAANSTAVASAHAAISALSVVVAAANVNAAANNWNQLRSACYRRMRVALVKLVREAPRQQVRNLHSAPERRSA